MKNKVMVFAMAAVAMLAVSCQKDRVDGMILIAEGFNNNNSKVLVNGVASAWATGDVVRINDKEASVTVAGSTASVSLGDEVTSPFYGVYPAGIYSSNSGDTYTLNLPATYTYAIIDGKQNLASPMVGYTTDNSTMVFKHVTAAIGVQVKNYHDYDVVVDSIEIISNNYQLSGTVTVDMGTTPTVNTKATPTTDEKSVKMKCNGAATLTVAASSSVTVQVPVLPVGSENKFTVKIWVHNASVAIGLSRTQGTAHSLGRAEIGYAMYTLGGPFTINSDGDKVVFSKGNLQYRPSDGAFQIAESQYAVIGSGNASYAVDYNGWIDLIDWTTATGTTITGWSVLSKDDWTYLIESRKNNAGADINRYIKGTLGSAFGTFIFPDDYVMPSGVSLSGAYNSKYQYFSTTSVSIDNGDWAKMELSGAIFLPVTGWRDGTTVNQITGTESSDYGYYWSSTPSSSQAYSLVMYRGNLAPANYYTNANKTSGHAVRLVKKLN